MCVCTESIEDVEDNKQSAYKYLKCSVLLKTKDTAFIC